MIKPKTPEEVIAFIGSNYSSIVTEWAFSGPLPLEEIEYTLTVHDLLSAFLECGD